MPRPRHIDRPMKKTISLPESIINEVLFILHDPLKNKAAYGFSEIIEVLLRKWLSGEIEIDSFPIPKANLKEFL